MRLELVEQHDTVGFGFHVRFGIGIGGKLLHQRADMIAAAQQQGDQLPVHRHFAIAHPIQHVLYHMGEGDDTIQPEHPARAFDGVGSAEYGADRLGVIRCGFQSKQRFLHGDEQLAALHEKCLQCLIESRISHNHSPVSDASSI